MLRTLREMVSASETRDVVPPARGSARKGVSQLDLCESARGSIDSKSSPASTNSVDPKAGYRMMRRFRGDVRGSLNVILRRKPIEVPIAAAPNEQYGLKKFLSLRHHWRRHLCGASSGGGNAAPAHPGVVVSILLIAVACGI